MDEAHPIPQNVTSFEFKLVGDMTLKQFLYLACGAGFAYLVFVLFAASVPVLAWPVIILSAGAGVAFAFLPLADRPLDYWVKAYFKAVYSPTKRIWKKGNQTYTVLPLFWQRLNLYLQHNFLENQPKITAINLPVPKPPATEPVKNKLPSKSDLEKTVSLAKEAQSLQVKIIEAERQLAALKSQAAQPGVNPQAYSQQITQAVEHLQELVSQTKQTRQQIDELKPAPAIKATVAKVSVVPAQPKAAPSQIVLTSTPNIINGIVKDSSSNYLDGAVVVIYDKEGLPVRALKTNKLGQFTGSTPLPNGTYTIETEKENLVFDVLKIELNGEVILPLQITAKEAVVS